MPTDRLAPVDARAEAAALVRALTARSPEALRMGSFDLGPALEQRIFFALRDGDGAGPDAIARWAGWVGSVAQAAGALGWSLVPRHRPEVEPGGVVAITRQPARMAILGPIDAALQRLGAPPLAVVRVGAAAEKRGEPGSATLTDLLAPSAVRAALGQILGPGRSLTGRAAGELPLIALGAAGIDSIIARWRPSLLVAFDEVGTWSRIIPTVARARGVPSLDLPHAEAADPIAIAGAGYDRFAVFGPQAAGVLRAAGIEPARIVETGAPHFDELIGPRRSTDAPASTRRILFAAQYVQGAMSPAGLAACYRGVLAAAEAVAPSELVVLPHPVQPPGQIEAVVAAGPGPRGVALRVEHEAGLHDLLDGAWLLATGWSNSIFEAALRGVPSLMVDPGRLAPVAYVADGLALGAMSDAEAAEAARGLLDPDRRQAAVAAAAAALVQHLGPLDGRASERTARLMLSMARAPAMATP